MSETATKQETRRPVKNAILLYQAGIANLFMAEPQEPVVRLVQSDFRTCEHIAAGLIMAGATVAVWNANVAGDALLQIAAWKKGAGGPFADQQAPPREAMYARVRE